MNILRTILFVVSLAVIAFLSSCGSYYYYPTQQHILKFKKKGDVTINAGMDSEWFESYGIGGSITDNIALITNLNTFRSSSGGKYKVDDYLLEPEIVLYKKLKKNLYPAVNIGYGFGQIDRNDEDFKLSIQRQFIQPSFGYSNDYIDVALSSRFTRANYDLSIIDENSNVRRNNDLMDLGNGDFYFFEPAITIGAGYKFVKWRYQMIFVNKLSGGAINYVDVNRILSVNLTFNMNNIYGDKEQ
ncbi:MAG: hypothetical protein ACI8WP_001029 [Flavobacteriaceae bacterium]|jgi:hypothetical protein